MIVTPRLPSKRVAVIGVCALALLIGVILAVQVTSRPAYEAIAEMEMGDPAPTPPQRYRSEPAPSLTEAARSVLESAEVAHLASSMAVNLEGRDPRNSWYRLGSLSTECPGCGLDPASIERSLRIQITRDGSSRVFVVFGADTPVTAQVGANLVVEAYLQILATEDSAPPVARLSYAPLPTQRADNPDSGEVLPFVFVSMLLAFLTWRWWPDTHEAEIETMSM